MKLRRRFTGESPLEFSGDYVKTFWTAWQLGTGVFVGSTLEAKVLSDNQTKRVDVSVSTFGTPPSGVAHSAFRVTEATRKIVDATSTAEKCFLDVTFSIQHSGNATSLLEVFSDTEKSITLELGNTEAKLTIFDEVLPVNDYSKMLTTLSPAGSTSRVLRYRLYSKITRYPIEGTRCFATIRASLSDNVNEFTASKDVSLFFQQNWQYESRVQTRS